METSTNTETTTYTLPAHWASYLINGDHSGISEEEKSACDHWLESQGSPNIVDVGEPYFTWHNDANSSGGDVCDYVALPRRCTQGTNAANLRDLEKSPRLSEIRAVYKSRKRVAERPQIRDAKDAERYLRAIWNHRTLELSEDFVLICLDGSHQAIGWVKVSSGGFKATTIDPRLIFAIALQTASTAIILAHNHPSGSLEPSVQDKAVTRQLREAGKLLGITVLDHLILTKESSLSFAETGLL